MNQLKIIGISAVSSFIVINVALHFLETKIDEYYHNWYSSELDKMKDHYHNEAIKEASREAKKIIEANQHNFQVPSFRKKEIAEEYLKKVQQVSLMYNGVVSIGDMYRILNREASYEDDSFGWFDISNFGIYQNKKGWYEISTGWPVPLDKEIKNV